MSKETTDVFLINGQSLKTMHGHSYTVLNPQSEEGKFKAIIDDEAKTIELIPEKEGPAPEHLA